MVEQHKEEEAQARLRPVGKPIAGSNFFFSGYQRIFVPCFAFFGVPYFLVFAIFAVLIVSVCIKALVIIAFLRRFFHSGLQYEINLT